MPKYAVGIIEHPITHRWQPWLYVEDGETISIACISSHSGKAQAHLVAQMLIDSYRAGIKTDIQSMLERSTESAIPDPLPQSILNRLISQIQGLSTKDDGIIGEWSL